MFYFMVIQNIYFNIFDYKLLLLTYYYLFTEKKSRKDERESRLT